MITPRPVARLALALPLLVGCSTSAPQEVSPIVREPVSFEDRLLATIPEEWDDVRGLYAMGIWFSPNGRSAAYLVWLTGELDEKPRCFIVLNGKKEPEVGRVGESRGMCSFSDGHPRFSPDGSRFGYAFRLGNQEVGREGVMVDGVMGPLFDQVSDPVFSQDGLQFAYEAVEGNKQLAVINHKVVSRQFDKAELPAFSSDGRRTAYRASMLGKAEEDGWREVISAFVVVDGVKGPECNWVGWPVFARNGDLAYIAQTNGAYNIRGDSTSDTFDYLEGLALSPDGRRTAFFAGRKGRFFMVVDGREFDARFPAYGDPFFSPDGRHVAYVGYRDAKGVAIAGGPPLPDISGRQCVVVDGEPGEDGSLIQRPVFGPRGKSLLYEMRQNQDEFVVLGQEKFGREFAGVEYPILSPDGSKLAFVATIRDEGQVVVCGKQRSETFDSIPGAPVFSPDGKKLAFGARKGRELWWKVMEVK